MPAAWAGGDLLYSLIDASPDFVFFKDGEGRWRIANRCAQELFQLRSAAWQGRTDAELMENANPALLACTRECTIPDEAAWQQGEALHCETSLVMPDGESRTYDVIKVPLFNADGSRRGLVVVGRDISRHVAVERQFASSSALLDALIASDSLLHSSEDWRKTAPEVLRLLGEAPGYDRVCLYENGEGEDGWLTATCRMRWQSSQSRELFPACDRLDYEQAGCGRWLASLQSGQPIHGASDSFPLPERRFLQHYGIRALVLVPVHVGEKWWGVLYVEHSRASGELSPQELGTLVAAGRSLGVAMQRDHADERLRQAMAAFESAIEGIMVTDAQSRIIAVNQGFAEITGYTEDEALGQTPELLASGRHDARFFEAMREEIVQHGRWRGEVWNRRKSGEIYPQWVTVNVVRDAENRIVNEVTVFSDISESKRVQDRLYELVNRDPLTGLPNRRLLNELMEHALRQALRSRRLLALLFIDLDRFKAVNDTLGHLVGDKLLLEVSKRLAGAVRESDTVARLGGDEFLIMMGGLRSREEAALVAKKILLSLQSEFQVDGRELYIGASIGISVCPDDAVRADELLKMADIAMYHVKHNGKNSYCYYSSDLSHHAAERFTLDVELRRALERSQFALLYQPRVDLPSGRIIGAEALLRWHHPELGMVSPAKFIPLAEETGLIVQIGEWVLREAAQQLVRWMEQGLRVETLSINVSGVQIQRSHFSDTVYGVLLETECEQGLLELEITESTVMHNTQHVSGVCEQIRQLGVRLAIDDFGTGYSSLSHLKRLPLDKLKVDQSFVRDLPHDEEDAAITCAIVALGHSLGLGVVAEGVETAAQEAFLREIGCDEAQGYYYSPPLDTAAFTELLRKQQAGGKA